MNKIININISGIIFSVDEYAYERLKQYLDRLKAHFRNTEGREEILADIEARIAEMLQENLKGKKEVVLMADVDRVIDAMGQPEDMEGAEGVGKEETYTHETYTGAYRRGKRLYRNPDDKWVGGVCGGMGAYFGVDPIWLRVALLIAFLTMGIGFLVYIILWIVIPEANSPSEKLEMYGEPVNISNIERTVKDNMSDFKKKVDGMGETVNDYRQRYAPEAKNFFERLVVVLKDLFIICLKLSVAFLVVIGIIVLISIAIGIIGALGGLSVSMPILSSVLFDSSMPLWLGVTGLALVTAIPFIAVIYYGIKLLFNVDTDLKWAGATMLVLWFVGLGLTAYAGIDTAKQFAVVHHDTKDDILNATGSDTIYVGVNNIDRYDAKFLNEIPFASDNGSIRYNDLDIAETRLDIQRSNDHRFHLTKHLSARGRNKQDARQYIDDISFNIVQQDSLLLIDPVFTLEGESKWRAQKAQLVLKVPVGKVVVLLHGSEEIIYDIDNVHDMYDGDMIGHKWLMTAAGLTCLDCPQEKIKPAANQISYTIVI